MTADAVRDEDPRLRLAVPRGWQPAVPRGCGTVEFSLQVLLGTEKRQIAEGPVTQREQPAVCSPPRWETARGLGVPELPNTHAGSAASERGRVRNEERNESREIKGWWIGKLYAWDRHGSWSWSYPPPLQDSDF